MSHKLEEKVIREKAIVIEDICDFIQHKDYFPPKFSES